MSGPPPATASKIARPLPRWPPPTATSLDDISRLPRSTTPISALNSTTTKQYRATLSTEAKPGVRSRHNSNARPFSPTKQASSDGLQSRPKTPTTPRKGAPSPTPFMSEMDVSRVDPEEVLVDCETVDPADISTDLFEGMLNGHGQEDKVLVSIRYVVSSHRVGTVY